MCLGATAGACPAKHLIVLRVMQWLLRIRHVCAPPRLGSLRHSALRLRLACADFGFGQARRRAEQFIRLFEEIYCLRRVRVRGEEVRILKCYPSTWQVICCFGPWVVDWKWAGGHAVHCPPCFVAAASGGSMYGMRPGGLADAQQQPLYLPELGRQVRNLAS